MAVAIAQAESSRYVNVVNRNPSPPTDDLGLWQVNDYYHSNSIGHSSGSELYDADHLYNLNLYAASSVEAYNAGAAFVISTSGRDWTQWATFYNFDATNHYHDSNYEGYGSYKTYLSDARYWASLADPATVLTGAGQGVKAVAAVNVRNTPGGSTNGLASRVAGDLGTVLSGPSALTQVGGSGPWYLWWQIQWSDGETGWSIENNLSKTGSSSAADLALQSITVPYMTYSAGGAITIGNVVKNIGGTTSSAYSLAFYASADTNITTGDYYIGTVNRSGLAPGATDPNTSSNGNLPANLPSGSYYIGAIITVSPDANTTNNVNYDPTPITVGLNYSLTTSSSPSTGGTTSGSGTFPGGSSRTVTATAIGGYSFVNWTESGSVVSNSASYTFTLNSNRNLVANFSANTVTHVISTSSSPSNGGTTSGGGTYAAGTSRTVTATANSGYTFSNWTESGNVVSTAADYTFTLNTNRTLAANFNANTVTYVISTSSSPSNGGTTSGDGTYTAGSSRTVAATANSGYAFSNWTENGSVVSTAASYTFTLNGNRTLIANFTANQATGLPTVATNAATSPASTSAVINGTVISSGDSPINSRFFYWGTANPPDQPVGDSAIFVSGNNFSAILTGLVPNTTYYFRAYAHNSSSANIGWGVGWNAGALLSFKTDPNGVPIANGAVIGLVANANGLYVTAESGGSDPLIANRAGLGAWEQFQITDLGDGTVALRSLVNGRFVCADNGGNSALIANRSAIGQWEKFQLEDAGNGNFAIIAKANGKYVCAENAGKSQLIANRTAVGGWEQFRMVFMPSVKPVNVTASFQSGSTGSYLCADGAGAGWLVANRAAEGAWEQFQLIDAGNGNVAVRSLINGLYVTAENAGTAPLIANRNTSGVWEQFELLNVGGGYVALRALANGRYVSAGNAGDQLIANRSYVGRTEQFALNVSLRAVANNAFVCAENSGKDPLIANRASIGGWEQFQVVNTSSGYFGLKAKANGLFVCAENNGNAPLIANRPGIGLWEQFQWISAGNGNTALKAAVNGMFVCAESGGQSALIANRPSASTWEQFR
ncbi:MAG: hypothetical protein QOH01_3543 [Verrucomicrobiota bacterium]|jgi:hypothetical protein